MKNFIDKKNITIHDIAKALNTTASTVSRALNNSPRISEKTKNKIRKYAEKNNYQQNTLASNFRKSKTKTIGVVVPHINRQFFSSIIGSIEQLANQSGYNVIICQSHDSVENEINIIKALLANRVEGLLISTAMETKTSQHFNSIIKQGIPLIFFDRVREDLNVSKVLIDDYWGAFLATEHLIGQGCRKIAHFCGAEHINIYHNRKLGYLDALKKYQIPIIEELIVENNLTETSGFESMEYLWEIKEKPDGLFSASDFAAFGAIGFLKNNQIKIPQDIAVIGFSNEPFAALVEPGLSSVDQFSSKIGENAIKLFLEEVSQNLSDFVPKTIILRPELIIRASSQRIKN